MNVLKTGVLFVLLSFLVIRAGAQQTPPLNEPDRNKPRIFSNLPDKMPLNITELESLFSLPKGSRISTQVTNQFRVNGTIVSKVEMPNSLTRGVIIRSSAFAGVVFAFTKSYQEDGTFKYIGRMMGTNYGDALEVTKENGQYFLTKADLYNLLSE
jgi:hypothetical protein